VETSNFIAGFSLGGARPLGASFSIGTMTAKTSIDFLEKGVVR
jgi:hypothetical protein